MCGCAGSRGSCSHDPAAPTPDNGLGGCGECEPHSDATPTPNAAPDNVVMSDACSSSVEMSPEAALQGLVGALRARHDPPPGQRAVPTNGWKAVDELARAHYASLACNTGPQQKEFKQKNSLSQQTGKKSE